LKLTTHHLRALVAELQALVGCYLDKVFISRRGQMVMKLSKSALRAQLLLSIEAGCEGFYVIQDRTPSATVDEMQARFRRELQGGRLIAIDLEPTDPRLIKFQIRRRDGGGLLLLELRAGRSQLLLLRGSEAANDSLEVSSRVEEARDQGACTISGEMESMLLVATLDPSRLADRGLKLGERYHLPQVLPKDAVGKAADSAEEFAGGEEGETFPISREIEREINEGLGESKLEQARVHIARQLRQELKRARRTFKKIEQDLKGAKCAQSLLEEGELLKASLHLLRRGMDQIELRDWYAQDENETRLLILDPKKSPTENVAARFKEARRQRRAGEIGEERSALIARRIAGLELLESMLGENGPDQFLMAALVSDRLQGGTVAPELACDKAAILQLVKELGLDREDRESPAGGARVQAAPRAKRGPSKRSPHRVFVAPEGHRVLVGKSARDNHQLTFGVARGGDLWFHVRDYPGSHVVLPLTKGEPASDRAMLDAGMLAAHFSEARGLSPVDVQWTERKHLRHPKGAAPGLVSVAKARGLSLREDAKRLRLLFDGEEKEG